MAIQGIAMEASPEPPPPRKLFMTGPQLYFERLLTFTSYFDEGFVFSLKNERFTL
jgi:hypothetical protein